MSDPEQIQCPDCNGEGFTTLRHVEFISDEDAIDSGDFGLKGQWYNAQIKLRCDRCRGDGFIIEEKQNE